MTSQEIDDRVRVCPSCETPRALYEFQCENVVDGAPCNYPLDGVEITTLGAAAPSRTTARPASAPVCLNGHPLEQGDQICLACGADAATPVGTEGPGTDDPSVPPELEPDLIVDGWVAGRTIAPTRPEQPWRSYETMRNDRRGLLTLYDAGHEPDPAVRELLRRTPLDHVPELLATGRYGKSAFEVFELMEAGTLADLPYAGADRARFDRIVDELAQALRAFADAGLRHRDLRPANVLVRTSTPLDLVVAGFGSARLADFDLEAVSPLELTRFSAPEAIVGAVSAASDWWSLGMILLEQATSGTCFADVADKAFHLHVVARGVDIPRNLEPDVRLILRGLLARDPNLRWSAEEVAAWLRGEKPEAPGDTDASGASGPEITLSGKPYRDAPSFALAACASTSWEEAKALTLRGAVATWLEVRGIEPMTLAEVRRIAADASTPEDQRHGLAMMALNAALPLTLRGDIVTPAWLLDHAAEAQSVIEAATHHLERLGREPWLVRMRVRAEAVKEKSKALGIVLDPERSRVAMLASSRANLEAERDALRRIFPDTEHAGLGSILGRLRPSEEDLVILVAASHDQFTPLAALVDQTSVAASSAGVALDSSSLPSVLVQPRRELFSEIDRRTTNFARCGNAVVDRWANAFRVERRVSLPQAAILLAVPVEAWHEPPRQAYVANLIDLFEKRITAVIGRGPLARFTVGKTTPRIDVAELGTGLRTAESILAQVLTRTDTAIALDPAAWSEDAALGRRLRRLAAHADTFKRDTGIDGRHLAFPFLVQTLRGAASRVVPVLLWPVTLTIDRSVEGGASLAFDPDRGDEVRLNPALEGLLGADLFERYRKAREDVLGRQALVPADIVDVFGTLASPQGRVVVPVPKSDPSRLPGSMIVCAAALFNVEFTGQSVASDLRALKTIPPAGTALEAAIRIVSDAQPDNSPTVRSFEVDRYLTAASDPSQDQAVLRSRSMPGLVVEGPPGTGKSQTIVNIVTDAIGRGESVLVVCQKQAALTVVQKRLDAEGLGDRLIALADGVRDRELLLRALQDQLESLKGRPSDPGAIRRQRVEKAAALEELERGLDRAHHVLHARDEDGGDSYRDMLGDLVAVEGDGPTIDALRLRGIVGGLRRDGIARLEEACAPVASAWLEARFEGSALSVLQRFAVDDAVAEDLMADLKDFAACEDERVAAPPGAFETDDPMPLEGWIAGNVASLSTMDPDDRVWLAATLDLYSIEGPQAGEGARLEATLRECLVALKRLAPKDHRSTIAASLAVLSATDLADHLADAEVAVKRVSFFGRLDLRRYRSRRRVAQQLETLGETWSEAAAASLHRALMLEDSLRIPRTSLATVEERLGMEVAATLRDLPELLAAAEATLEMLEAAGRQAARVLACPMSDAAVAMARDPSAEALATFRHEVEGAIGRHRLRSRSAEALERLAPRFTTDWIGRCRDRMASGAATSDLTFPVLNALPTLFPYQRFRSQAAGMEAGALGALAVLRVSEGKLRMIPAADLEGVVRRTIRREWLKARKAALEERHPELLLSRVEVTRRVERLADLDDDMRRLNKNLLAADVAAGGTPAQWGAVTRLTGRSKRLREVFEAALPLGLTKLRPVWLMSPDVASRILPLAPGLFDLVIFDEASQMPVEHAVPTLFRGKRVVIAGDEKQMPPTNLVGAGRLDVDDADEGADTSGDEGSEAGREAADADWNRRDIAACPDLLQLGRGFLPTTTLQIHYRSQYRELIAFSNAAFYKSALSVPARHPDAEVRRRRPIEVIRADGLYEGQTNPAEAACVVEKLAKLWAVQAGERPSVGVVTFNLKQADLVEEAVDARAAEDESFGHALAEERARRQGGEDMGFFVKNVENVQGDERDVIIFSTTFGKDRRGTFRRLFGLLGQVGGERRLNVAVTRARSKIVLVTSIPVAQVSDWSGASRAPEKPRDYLQAYLDYAAKISAGDLDLARGLTSRLGTVARHTVVQRHGPDGFEASVARFIKDLGHTLAAAPDGGDAFGLDFAIVDPATGLFGVGIECDAPRHPLLAQARGREIWRRKVLERSIPAIHRVSSRDWYENAAEERDRLATAIQTALSGRSAA